MLRCISSVNFSILLNGTSGKKFAPSRGLGKGDLLSPYLFLFGSEIFSILISRVCDQHVLYGVQLNRYNRTISHIFFADDTFLFLQADKENYRNLVTLLEQYCVASGQQVNLQKSSVFFGSDVPTVLANELGAIIRMPHVANPWTYLDVPAM